MPGRVPVERAVCSGCVRPPAGARPDPGDPLAFRGYRRDGRRNRCATGLDGAGAAGAGGVATERADRPGELRQMKDTPFRERATEIQARLAAGLARVDPHHRLLGRPVSYRVIAGQTFEIVYRDVARIEEAELLGVKKLIGEHCFCSVITQT